MQALSSRHSLPKKLGNESVPEYAAARVAEKLERVQNVVRHNLNVARLASCKWYNRKVKPKSFDVGQTVRVYYPRRYGVKHLSGNLTTVRWGW